MNPFNSDLAGRLNALATSMREHDWRYLTSDDSAHWQRMDENIARITRESWELRHLGLESEVTNLWNIYSK